MNLRFRLSLRDASQETIIFYIAIITAYDDKYFTKLIINAWTLLRSEVLVKSYHNSQVHIFNKTINRMSGIK